MWPTGCCTLPLKTVKCRIDRRRPFASKGRRTRAARSPLTRRPVRRKLASGPKRNYAGECAFVLPSLAAELPWKSRSRYDELVSGRAVYSYVGNDPLGHTDPSGKCIEDLCIGEAIALITFVSEALEGTGLVEGSIEAASLARTTVVAGAAARGAEAGVEAARAVRGGAAPVRAGEAGANVAESTANAAGYTSAGREVTASTATGTTRYDRVMNDGTKNVGVEVKTGPNARLNPNQRTQQGATNAGADTTMRGGNARAAGLEGQAIDHAEVMHVNGGKVTAWYCVVSFLCSK